jgi:hypothetical protein
VIYFKSTLLGLVTVLVGCVIAPIILLMRARSMMTKSGIGSAAIGISPIELMHTTGFWVFVMVLFRAGFLMSLFFLKR